MRVRGWPVLGIVLAVLWVFVRDVPLAADAVAGQFLVGIAVGTPIAFVFRRLYPDLVDVGRGVRVVPYSVAYVLVFLREIVVANVDVAYRVLAPGPPIDPEVILIPLRVRTNLGITTIANSITITPGTVTLDHDPDANALYVHVIDGRTIDEVVDPIRTWEDYSLLIFDEELSPDDPAPAITVDGTGTVDAAEPGRFETDGNRHDDENRRDDGNRNADEERDDDTASGGESSDG